MQSSSRLMMTTRAFTRPSTRIPLLAGSPVIWNATLAQSRRMLSSGSNEPPVTSHPKPASRNGDAEPTVFNSKAHPTSPSYYPEIDRKHMGVNRTGYKAEGRLPTGAQKTKSDAKDGEKHYSPRDEESSFAGPSRPRMVYPRPKVARKLPQIARKWPQLLAFAIVGLGAWGVFLLYVTNAERLSSSPVRQISYTLRNSSEIKELLGDNVRFAPNPLGFGDPWVSGEVSLLKGKVDVKFKVEGTKNKATVYFTSIRPKRESRFQIVRYKVIADDGQVVHLSGE